jgi:hypothetical protein
MVKLVRDGLGLDLRVRVGLVNQGGPDGAPAWVSCPKPLPQYGTPEFKRTLVTIFLRKSFLAENKFEAVVMAIAHEFSHIVLFGIKHPLEEDEVAVDLTAMLLGYRDFYSAGSQYREVRPKSLWQRFVQSLQKRRTYQSLGYLSPEEVRYAAVIMGKPKEELPSEATNNFFDFRTIFSIVVISALLSGSLWSASIPKPPIVEVVPPVGSGNPLSSAQIKYCLAEQIRVDGARSVLNQRSENAVNRFNAMIDDYNSRCSNFRYRGGDYQRAQSEVEPDRGTLSAAGRSRF